MTTNTELAERLYHHLVNHRTRPVVACVRVARYYGLSHAFNERYPHKCEVCRTPQNEHAIQEAK